MKKNTYHNAIRDLVNRGNRAKVIRHQIGSDEIQDPSLVALRVYGNRSDYDVIMVCAGTNAVWEPLPDREILLPSRLQLVAIKKQFGAFLE